MRPDHYAQLEKDIDAFFKDPPKRFMEDLPVYPTCGNSFNTFCRDIAYGYLRGKLFTYEHRIYLNEGHIMTALRKAISKHVKPW